MFERWIGAKPFQKGIRQYLKQRADQTATTGDFLGVMSRAVGYDVTHAFGTFLDQPGIPLVTAELRCADGAPRLKLSQQRSLPIGSRDETSETWTIPVCVKYPSASGRGAARRECALMSSASFEMKFTKTASCPAWVLANEGETGYYRVLYRNGMLGKLLADDGRRLTLAERVGVLGDVGALATAGQIPAVEALTVAQTFSKDPDWRVVSQTIGIAGMLRDAAVPDELLATAARFLRRVYGERAHQLGWKAKPEDSDGDNNLRRQLVSLVASAGQDEELAREASRLALGWLDDPGSLDADTADTVVMIAAANGDQALFERMRAELHKAEDDRRVSALVVGMGSFRDPAIVKQRLAFLLTNEFDFDEVMGMSSPTRETSGLLFEFVQQHVDALAKRLQHDAAYLPTVGEDFCSAAERAEVESFFKPRVEQYEGGPKVLAQTLQTIDLCITRRQALGPSLTEFLKKYEVARRADRNRD